MTATATVARESIPCRLLGGQLHTVEGVSVPAWRPGHVGQTLFHGRPTPNQYGGMSLPMMPIPETVLPEDPHICGALPMLALPAGILPGDTVWVLDQYTDGRGDTLRVFRVVRLGPWGEWGGYALELEPVGTPAALPASYTPPPRPYMGGLPYGDPEV